MPTFWGGLCAMKVHNTTHGWEPLAPSSSRLPLLWKVLFSHTSTITFYLPLFTPALQDQGSTYPRDKSSERRDRGDKKIFVHLSHICSHGELLEGTWASLMSILKVLMKPGILDLLDGLSYSRPTTRFRFRHSLVPQLQRVRRCAPCG